MSLRDLLDLRDLRDFSGGVSPFRRALAAVPLTAFLVLGGAGCGSSGGGGAVGGGGNGTLPSQPAPSASATSMSAAPAVSGSAAASGLRSFAFPASVSVQFQTPLPASGPQRDAMIGYENYIDSLWYAVYTRGASTAYKQYLAGNALTFAQQLISYVKSNDYTLSGKIVYFDISVPQVYYNAGAVVQACVDASGLHRVNAKTGTTAGTILPASFDHYQEQASDGKSQAGYWWVSHTVNYPASQGGSAGICV